MAKFYKVTLTEEERSELERIISIPNSKSIRTKRSYILLASDENGDKHWTDKKIQIAYGMTINGIERMRKRFVEHGFEAALYGKKREYVKEKIFDGRVESHLLSLRCEEVPDGHSGWSLRLLADKMVELEYVESISHESIRQILKKTKLNPGESKVG
jgi:hypothetical protein|tara:strand:+ start:234 stop:704 length:471 start_codon:yes stop_codon:yes gene_type:complete